MIRHLRLWQYANILEAELEFKPGANALVGPNGSGKTNVLGAIAALGLGKNPFKSADKDAVVTDTRQWAITGKFDKEYAGAPEKVHLSFQLPATKQLKVNDAPFSKITEWPGNIPVVVAAPDDSFVLNDASEERRRFLDMFICQTDSAYLSQLGAYKKLLLQRNALLKQGKERGETDLDVLEAIDYQIYPLLEPIYQARVKAVAELQPALIKTYAQLAGEEEEVNLALELSEGVGNTISEKFKNSLKADMAAGRSLAGPHRDDLEFFIKKMPLKRFGSQGQNKSFVLALKLGQISCLEKSLNRRPLVLLDDVFDKLDEERIKNLLQMLSESDFPQFILTDARPERTASLLGSTCKVHRLKNGEFMA